MFNFFVDRLSRVRLHFVSVYRDLLAILGGTLLLSLAGRIAVPLPFNPVPLSLQTLGIYVVGLCLGSKKGGAAMLLYLLQGALGLPVFAGGTCGVIHLFGVTGGYLWGFIPGIIVAGRAGASSRLLSCFKYLILAALTIMLSGSSVLMCLMGVKKGLLIGCVPFIIPEIFKIIIAVFFVKGIRRLKDCGRSWIF